MTPNEIRYVFPGYAEKERLLREQAEWAKRFAQCERISLEEARRRGIISDREQAMPLFANVEDGQP